jgi:hypothetical protein
MRLAKARPVVGIDLSLTRAAAVYLREDWVPGSWAGVESMVVGEALEKASLAELAGRLAKNARRLTEFAARRDRDGLLVAVEDLVGGLAGKGGLRLAGLDGALKAFLFEAGIVATPINVSTARKTLLGKVPQGKGAAPAAVQAVLARMGSPWAGSDQGDAWCIANHLRSIAGMSFVSVVG